MFAPSMRVFCLRFVLSLCRIAHEHHGLEMRPRADPLAIADGGATQLLDELVAQVRPLRTNVFCYNIYIWKSNILNT